MHESYNHFCDIFMVLLHSFELESSDSNSLHREELPTENMVMYWYTVYANTEVSKKYFEKVILKLNMVSVQVDLVETAKHQTCQSSTSSPSVTRLLPSLESAFHLDHLTILARTSNNQYKPYC